MRPEVYMGIDPSQRAFTIVSLGSDGEIVDTETYTVPSDGPKGLYQFQQWFRHKLAVSDPCIVSIEGYSFGSKGARVFQAGELGGIARAALAEPLRNLEYVIVPPTRLKKFACGKGNAGKPQVAVGIWRRWEKEFASDDEADAFVLAKIAYHLAVYRKRGDLSGLTQYQQEVITELAEEGNDDEALIKPKRAKKTRLPKE